MKNSICGANCDLCPLKNNCEGCAQTNGCPFGKQCFIASYINVGGKDEFEKFKSQIIDEFNNLNIDGMSKVEALNPLLGNFVNLEYTLPNGETVKFLDDKSVYLGNQLECDFDPTKCFGIVAGPEFLLVCTYEKDGESPELIMYKKR